MLSGPAAGALGAALVTRTAGFDRVLTLDGGGTSTDVSVVLRRRADAHHRGHGRRRTRRKIPMIDIVTVGAGGGSVAWLVPEGTLKVGPRSAGADPGPLCYGRGGIEPTVTDAHLVLGRIPPHLLGGEVPLDAGGGPGRAAGARRPSSAWTWPRRPPASWRSRPGTRPTRCARSPSKRGLDVRDFALTTFGGSGSLLACRLIDILGVPAGVVPRDPGNLSAFGLLTVDVKDDHVQTHVARHAGLDLGGRGGAASPRCATRPRRRWTRRASPAPAHRFVRSADLRYFGQAFEVRVPVPDGPFDAAAADAVVAAFHDAHERALRLLLPRTARSSRSSGSTCGSPGSARSAGRRLRPLAAGRRHAGPAPARGRSASTPPTWPRRSYWRPSLRPGAVVPGPAIIEEYGSTVPLHPGFAATVDRLRQPGGDPSG